MRRLAARLTILLGALLAATGASADEGFVYGLADARPGEWVEYDYSFRMGLSGSWGEMPVRVRYTIVEASEEAVTIRMEYSQGGVTALTRSFQIRRGMSLAEALDAEQRATTLLFEKLEAVEAVEVSAPEAAETVDVGGTPIEGTRRTLVVRGSCEGRPVSCAVREVVSGDIPVLGRIWIEVDIDFSDPKMADSGRRYRLVARGAD